MQMRIFVDMDGVLADFDSGYAKAFGKFGGKDADDVDWSKVRAISGFYSSLPPMPDFDVLWKAIVPYQPTILTGVPSEVPEAAENKREWATKYVGPHVDIITCKSREKCLHGKPGDILIDDWEKYKHLWISMGGVWITHVSATESVRLLTAHLPSQV